MVETKPLALLRNAALVESSSLPTKYITAATSNNTRRAYQSDIKQFIKWGGLLPTTAEQLINYLHQHAEHLNSNTLSRRLTAISKWHEYQGFDDPTKHTLVKKTLTGIQKTHGKPKDKAPALQLNDLIKMSQLLKHRSTIFDLRNRALLLVGYFGAFRRSELVSIRYENISFKEEGMEILIPKSKTDQLGEGQVCAIPNGNQDICAVSALQHWCEQAGINSGSIFLAINRHEEVRDRQLSPQSVNLIVKSSAKDIGLENSDKYSGHSLRRGFATCASQKGASFASIMKQGRWKSEKTVLGYFEEGQRFQDNAANILLNNKD